MENSGETNVKPTLTLVVELDADTSMFENVSQILEAARGYGKLLSAKVVNVPSELDVTEG